MALVIADRVRETTTTAGTGSVTLAGAVTGFQSFSVIGDTNTCYYCISDQSGSNWEVGIGTYSTTGPTLDRTTVLASSNAGSLVSFGSNTKDVFVTQPAERAVYTQATGNKIEIYNPVIPSNDGWGVIECVDDGLGDAFNDLNIYLEDQYGNKNAPFFSGGIASADFVIRSQDWTTNYKYVQLYAPSGMGASYALTLPSTSGSANQVLKTDGTGVTSWVTIDPLTLTGISDPTAPTGTNTKVYSKSFGGYATLAGRNALNTSFGLQSALWSKNIQMWTTTNAAAGSWLNASGLGYGTYTNQFPVAGSTLYQTVRRSVYANVITTPNQLLGVANGQVSFFRGSVAGQGGYFFYARCGFDVWTNGGRFFAGMTQGTTVVTANPSATNNTTGFAVEDTDAGAISFITRSGGATTKTSVGLTITSNKGYDCYIYCSPNASQITWQIIDINTGTSVTGTENTNLPSTTQMVIPEVLASNAALTTADAIKIGVAKIYVESDY